MRTLTRKIELRSDDPAPNGANTHEHDLVFEGVVLLELEQLWNDDQTRGTNLDGEIVERVAIYRQYGKRRFLRGRTSDQFIAEQCRYNPRVILRIPGARSTDDPIPFFSHAKRFSSLALAADWLRSEGLASDGCLRNRLDAELKQMGEQLNCGCEI